MCMTYLKHQTRFTKMQKMFCIFVFNRPRDFVILESYDKKFVIIIVGIFAGPKSIFKPSL